MYSRLEARGKVCNGCIFQCSDISCEEFARCNLPSTWDANRVAWIYLTNFHHTSDKCDTSYNGKWMWFRPPKSMDNDFLKVAMALQEFSLGKSVKVRPFGNSNETHTIPIIVYTEDFRDRDDVLRVGLALRSIGARGTISYKPDVFTLSEDGIYGTNKIPKSIYSLKDDGSNKLFITNGGSDYDIAVNMIRDQFNDANR